MNSGVGECIAWYKIFNYLKTEFLVVSQINNDMTSAK